MGSGDEVGDGLDVADDDGCVAEEVRVGDGEADVAVAVADWLAVAVAVAVGSAVPGVGEADPLPTACEDDADGLAVLLGSPTGSAYRMPTISDLKVSSWSEISISEYDVIDCANLINRFHTSASACSCSSPGVSSTDSTSWLAMAAVMQR